MMKLSLHVVCGFAVLGVALWILTSAEVPRNSPFLPVVFMVFMVPPIGSLWMVYMSVRYELKPLPMILLAFLPYSFVWYYFERYRPRKRTTGGAPFRREYGSESGRHGGGA